ncbi:1,4-alpha-glucan branching enzyme [Micromonospora phaseoli]|uniref:1,4-alpha-glucan branching enzyme GlgB n=1 Tax=Micromonospora phaseoli TaxID=1144548 RepID=A0A1H6SNJ5_9ACTN|nr:1,4-alpha-glucan branching protein GlgB [Micromonospora phaseoli]PZW03899.1 1,4-alpha-glucan branching enzyme [Micromonospora phaseoli]GIJ77686.1 1,4-alpha-glucan branching enzyme GlgB [Micromonospora phaseoli]SEI65580.1 1,4-alpha-glucan branching enzyme [Micromonospora phaseoli]
MDQLISGEIHDPHAVLGAHPAGGRTVIRTLRRGAGDVSVLVGDERHPMKRVHDVGVFEATVPGEVLDYRVDVDGRLDDDPYRHPPVLGELDLHLIGEGRHERLWEALGARVLDGGVAFAVWAPNARGVRVIGDFTGWAPDDGWPMRSLGSTGVWEIFVPGASAGSRYKYRVLGADGYWRDKADPLAAYAEVAPANASVVHRSTYQWGDADWLARRSQRQPHQEPMSVYEVHLGSWRPGLGYRELAEQLTAYVVELGFTHVEFLPVMEHPFGGSWGYQVTGYYAPTARFGNPDDFRYLVDRLHAAGIGVILDWVPAHFPKDDWALARFDGTPLYEHPDPRRGEHPDWGTYVFDFGRREVRNFLVANALYWLDEFHVDGLRVDAVASMLYLDYSRSDGQWAPNVHGGRENLEALAFLQEVNATVYKQHAGVVMIAEESTAWPGVTRSTGDGGLGFGFKWNMGWMHDTLLYTSKDPIYRQHHHHQLTFSLAYAWSENYVLPISHDEVVHGKGSLLSKMPGDMWQRLANVRVLLAYMWAHPGKQLLFMGCELADDREWSEERGLDWYLPHDPARAGVQRLVGDLNRIYRETPPLWAQDTSPAGFRWLAGDDVANNAISFVRIAPDGATLVCVANFSALPLEDYRVGLPAAGAWAEVLNTDAHHYGGSGVGNLGTVHAEDIPWHGLPASAALRVPPLGALWLHLA